MIGSVCGPSCNLFLIRLGYISSSGCSLFLFGLGSRSSSGSCLFLSGWALSGSCIGLGSEVEGVRVEEWGRWEWESGG